MSAACSRPLRGSSALPTIPLRARSLGADGLSHGHVALRERLRTLRERRRQLRTLARGDLQRPGAVRIEPCRALEPGGGPDPGPGAAGGPDGTGRVAGRRPGGAARPVGGAGRPVALEHAGAGGQVLRAAGVRLRAARSAGEQAAVLALVPWSSCPRRRAAPPNRAGTINPFTHANGSRPRSVHRRRSQRCQPFTCVKTADEIIEKLKRKWTSRHATLSAE